ncbi:MAG TPA: TonB-dependent receptor [Chitinophagales bacterium]|nr:TonB-dependent receptor [Chitinophagales bacterium]
MKKLILLASFAVFYLTVFSQTIINGIVISEESNEPLAGVAVLIKGTFSGTFTGADGRFSIQSKKDSATLVFSHLSFENKEVATSGQMELVISLKPKPYLADEVIVSATRAGKTASTSYEEVSQEDIYKQNLAQDIPYLIDQTPSIVTTSDPGTGVGYSYLRIRGSNQSRINVTINGIPYNDPESQEVYWVDLPDFASSVDNIQIQRGVGTSTNGAGAFGGTINIQTTKLQREPYGELSGSYGYFNTWKATAKFGTGLIKNKFTVDGRLSQIKSDGYIDRASSDLKSFFLSGGYYGAKNILRVNVFQGLEETYQAWWGVPEGALDTNRTHNYYSYPDEVDRYTQDHYQLLFSQQAGKYWTVNSALHYTHGKGYYEQYRGPEYNYDLNFGVNSKDNFSDYGLSDLVIGDTTITETSLVRRRWLDNHFYGLTFSALYEKNKLVFTLGGAANRYNGNHFGEIIWAEFAHGIPKDYRYYDNDGNKNDANVFVKLSYSPVKNLNTFVDLQYRYVSHEIAGSDNDLRYLSINKHHHFFNPKLGFSYSLNSNHELYASFAIGNREPARNDYTDAPEDRLPQPERLRDLEAGYRFVKAKNLLSVNYYFMHYKDQLVLTGEVNDVGSLIKTNVDKSYRTGIEIMNSFKPVEQFQWNVNITYSANKIKDFTEVLYVYDADYNLVGDTTIRYSHTDISYSPSFIAGSTISVFPLKELELSLISKYVSEQFLDNTGSDDRKINGYLVNNVRINYKLKKKFFDEIRFTLALNNLFNTFYESNGYTFGAFYEDEMGKRSRTDYNYFFPQAGFNIIGGVTVRL